MPGTYVLPTNGSQIAAANFDRSGTTRLGKRLDDHSFFVPALVLGLTSAIAGGLMGLVVQGWSTPSPRARTSGTNGTVAQPGCATVPFVHRA
jgi:hypothetical protein